MRTLSAPAAAAAASEEQSDPILLFVELDLGGSGFIRIVNNWEAVTRNGNEHSPYHFEISYETLMVRAFPHKRFIPIDFPGAF